MAFDVVAIGASLGGVEALRALLGMLPPAFPASIVIVQHRSRKHRSYLGYLLNRTSALPVVEATAGEHLQRGCVYLAPPNQHLRVNHHGRLILSGPDAPLVNFTRPAVDVLFTSVADAFGDRAIGVVLTGMQRDGAVGIERIKDRGGRVLVQDPRTARAPGMPHAALSTGCVDFALSLPEIAAALTAFVMVPGAAELLRLPCPIRPESPLVF